MSVTLLIVDPWQYCVRCIRSGATRCTFLMVLYLDRIHVPVRVTRGALVAHRYTYAPPRCRTSQYRRTFSPLSVSLWNDLANPVFDGVGLAGFKSRAIFLIGLSCAIPTIVFYYFSFSLPSVYRLELWGWDLRTDRLYITLSQLALPTFF